MRLLQRNDKSEIVFTDYLHEPPPYAVLSHTWGRAADEVSYQDIIDGSGQKKDAYVKIEFIAAQAEREGLHHFWVDTCCIDKRNDAEVSTAIRSMFRWYKESAVCYVYLADVSANKRASDGSLAWIDTFRGCRWFKRGWTLQELIAPRRVEFYARGQHLGTRDHICETISEITGIDTSALKGRALETFSFSTRLRWASGRETSRPEDLAYALMGLCGIVMTPRYGEGREEARRRLERKIMKIYGENALDRSQLSAPTDLTGETSREGVIQQRQNRLESLDFESKDARKLTIKKALRKTCGWILKHPAYVAWRQTHTIQQHHGFFWIRGKPGSGKSVLMKYLDNHISSTKDQTDICISFYFNARGERLEKSVLGMYRSLLSQLLLADPSLQSVLDNSRMVTGGSDSTIQELQRVFLNATLRLKGHRLFCFIDALDECREEDVQQMVDYFRDLGQEAAEEDIFINVCFASRHYPALDIDTGLQLVLENVVEHFGDLREYVQCQKFRVGIVGRTESIPASMQEEILEKANGVFLWIVLVLDILKKEYQNGRIHAVKRRLGEIPKGLSELFQDILHRDRANIDEFLLCLKWILYAKRPLALREFFYAMMAGTDEQTLEWNHEVTENIMHSFLLSSSKGLAELTKAKPQRAQFIHESVRDFLITEEGLKHLESDQGSSEGQCHERLKKCCLRGIECNLSTFRNGINSSADQQSFAATTWRRSTSNEMRNELIKHFPFLDYATSCIFYHSDQAAEDVSQIKFMTTFDVGDWADKANLIQEYEINLYRKPVNLLYIWAERDYANLIKTLTDYSDVMKMLADHGADINAQGGPYGNALQVASAKGLERIVKVLLEHGAGVNVQRGCYGNALQAACAGNHKDVIKLLLAQGANVNLQGGLFGNALQAAAAKGYTDISELLINQGALVDTRGGHFGSALQAACAGNHQAIIELLLRRGANVNLQGGFFGNPLQAASGWGSEDIVELLLDLGADINAQGGSFGNALQAACVHGCLYSSTDVPCTNVADDHKMLRQYDCIHAITHPQMQLSLLEQQNKRRLLEQVDVDILCSTRRYETCRDRVVKLLLCRGASINARGGPFSNALQAGSGRSSVKIVELLLQNGADINARGGPFGTALQAAVAAGRKDTVELLQNRAVSVSGDSQTGSV